MRTEWDYTCLSWLNNVYTLDNQNIQLSSVLTQPWYYFLCSLIPKFSCLQHICVHSRFFPPEFLGSSAWSHKTHILGDSVLYLSFILLMGRWKKVCFVIPQKLELTKGMVERRKEGPVVNAGPGIQKGTFASSLICPVNIPHQIPPACPELIECLEVE